MTRRRSPREQLDRINTAAVVLDEVEPSFAGRLRQFAERAFDTAYDDEGNLAAVFWAPGFDSRRLHWEVGGILVAVEEA
jgi:hypothetical protein